jgi:hypothetical protein
MMDKHRQKALAFLTLAKVPPRRNNDSGLIAKPRGYSRV